MNALFAGNVPNLDDFTTDRTQVALAYVIMGQLTEYLSLKCDAMGYREQGNIEAALKIEAVMERSYTSLPPWAKW